MHMDAILELVAHKESEIWTCLLHSFSKEGLIQLPGVCSLGISGDISAKHDTSDAHVHFEQHSLSFHSPIAAMADP